jgi:hypothetical protein
MECLVCKGNHRYKDLSHINDKVRAFHNVQQEKKMEDMGIIVPRIYASLNNKKEKYKSHMIEVEGMINNQTITILIDSGSSHSYIDPRMVESLHLLTRKHGKAWLVQLATGAKRKVVE